MKRGVPPTARNARTGEFTPPGVTASARSNRACEAGAVERGMPSWRHCRSRTWCASVARAGSGLRGAGDLVAVHRPRAARPRGTAGRAAAARGRARVADRVHRRAEGRGTLRASSRRACARGPLDVGAGHLLDRLPARGRSARARRRAGRRGRPGGRPSRALQAGGRVGEPAAGLDHEVGQARHPQASAGASRQHGEDLVLGQLEAVGLQVAVERLLEEPAAAQVGAPGLLLVVGEPARLSPAGWCSWCVQYSTDRTLVEI